MNEEIILFLLGRAVRKSPEGVIDTLHTLWYDYAGHSDIVLGSDEDLIKALEQYLED